MIEAGTTPPGLPTSVGAAAIGATFAPLVAEGIRRRAALGNSLAVPDVCRILERVKGSVQRTLELHHWPEPDWAVNDNSADAGSAKVAIHKRGASCGGSRLKPKLDTKFGLGGFEKKFKSLPTEKWDWAA